MPNTEYDIVIVGGGVTGTALLFVLSRYTNVGKIALVEKYSGVAEVNSHPLNNAQTSHDGGTETNHNLKEALEIQKAAIALRRYVEMDKDRTGLFRKTHRMVLGVGEEEVHLLKRRFETFKEYYPDLRFIERAELELIEPKIVEGRSQDENICALVSTEGYAINYQILSESFLEHAQSAHNDIDTFFDTKVSSVSRKNGVYHVSTDHGTLTSHIVVFAAGPYSLLFAQELGYGLEYGILPVAGSFYSTGKFLNGKVYTVQIEGIPFAAVHGDPDVLNADDTRFGPTTKPLPLLERHHYETIFDFLHTKTATLRGLLSLLKIISDKRIFWFTLESSLYDLPIIGKYIFLKKARKIIPTLKYRDLKLRKGVGGIRPQIVDLVKRELQMGEATIVGENVIFNTTPSPGASVCLANAQRDTKIIIDTFLGEDFHFDEERFKQDFKNPNTR